MATGATARLGDSRDLRWKRQSILRPYVLQIISDGDFTYLVKRVRSGYRFWYACRMRRQSLGAALIMGSVCCLSYHTVSMTANELPEETRSFFEKWGERVSFYAAR